LIELLIIRNNQVEILNKFVLSLLHEIMKLTNSVGRAKGSRSSMDNDQAEKSKTTRDKTKKLAATESSGGNKNNDKQRNKAKGWRKALNDGDTTEDAESSALSDLSDSTEDGYDDNGAATSVAGERSEDYELFEKALRSKHSKACKAMSVGLPCANF
jgi:hypothetical protein